jgi:hypothetical protein
MSERRDVMVRLATGLIVLVSLTAASIGLSRIHDEKELIFSNYRGEASTAMEVEIEYLRLRHALAQLASGGEDPGGRDDPRLRYDRFRQSFADLLDREGTGDQHGLPEIGESIAAIERGLSEVEEALLDVKPSGAGGVRTAQERLDGIYDLSCMP